MSINCRIKVERKDFTLDVDLCLADAGITGVTGVSGSGKTTLLRAIAGLEKSSEGNLKIGTSVWQNMDQYLPAHQRKVGYVFQEASLFSHLNVEDNINYGLRRTPEDQRKIAIEHTIELLGIGSLLKRKPWQLSGGEKQRVSIARALAVSPKLLLMDEPLSALDTTRKREFMPYLETLQRELKIPIIYVSHSLDELARLADQLILLDRGKVVATGDIADLLTRSDLPLAQGDDANSVISAKVDEHDNEFNLTYIRFPGGRFTVPKRDLPVDAPVRLSIAARDVSLTTEQQLGTSILNIVAVTVSEINPEGESQVMVKLDAQGTPLLSRITRKSARLLALKKGSKVFAQIKSVALWSTDNTQL